MKKVTQKMIDAIQHRVSWGGGNTMVHADHGRTIVLLHGNRIATIDYITRAAHLTLAGWPTPTTRDRLNGVCRAIKVHGEFCQRGHRQFFCGREIAPYETVKIDMWIA